VLWHPVQEVPLGLAARRVVPSVASSDEYVVDAITVKVTNSQIRQSNRHNRRTLSARSKSAYPMERTRRLERPRTARSASPSCACGLAQIRQDSVAHVLRYEPAKALHGAGDAFLIGGDYLA
jgi:hypothetical protein